MHIASSLHNQGNGFSFRHLTLLSKENPSLVLLWTEVALSSVTDPSKRLMGTGMGPHHGTTPPPMPNVLGLMGQQEGDAAQNHAPKDPIPLPTGLQTQSGKSQRDRERDMARACWSGPQSVLGIHGIQILGFNDSGQQVVAGQGDKRP